MQRLTSFAAAQFTRQHPQHANHPHLNHSQHPSHDMPRNSSFQRQQNPSISSLPPGTPVSWCFKVPFNNTLPGPDVDLAIYSSRGAVERWTQLPDAPEDAPIHSLPVHEQHLENLKIVCHSLKERSGVEAIVTVGKATALAPMAALQPSPTNNIIANVSLHGPGYDIVRRVRELILNGTPITLVCYSTDRVFCTCY
jgi:hypothetical protein